MGKEKIGLTLAGGGTKGAYQIGVYKAMIDAKIKISGVTGTSIGSFNAALIASGDFDKLTYFWENDDIGKLMNFFDDMNIDVKSYKDLFKEFTIPYISMIKNKGIPIDGLKNRITEIVKEKELRNSDIDFGLVTYKLKDKKPLYLFKENIPNGKMIDYIIASCYLPVFNMQKLDDDSYYLDGGFVDNLPYKMLVDKGYDKIYVVDLGSIGITKKYKCDAQIIKIKPSRNLGGILNTNKYQIKKNIELGYYDGIKIFKNLDGHKFIFKKRNEWFYNFLVRKVPNKIRKRVEVFFLTRNSKELVLKSIEYVLKKEKKTYLNIYKPYKEIRRIKKIYKNEKKLIVHEFISSIKLF